MTTIINAVSGSGLTQTADGSGIVKLQSNGVTTNALAWANFNGTLTSPITPRSAYNVGSVTKNATGDYTLNFTVALSDANYSVVGMGSTTTGGAASSGLYTTEVLNAGPALARTTTAFRFYTLSSSFNAADGFSTNIVVFGN